MGAAATPGQRQPGNTTKTGASPWLGGKVSVTLGGDFKNELKATKPASAPAGRAPAAFKNKNLP